MTAAQSIVAPVQAQAVHLLLGPVAAQAAGLEYGLDIADEIDNSTGTRLGGKRHTPG
jgi:hypothetical protein